MDKAHPKPIHDSLRIFFAIDLPLLTRNKIANLLQTLQKQYSHFPIRWTKIENLHVTLQFLPAVKPADIEKLLTHVRKQLECFPAFSLTVDKLVFFPYNLHPHVIALNFQEDKFLNPLAHSIGKGMANCGYTPETRGFKGHLTLARFDFDKHPIEDLIETTFPQFETFFVEKVTLYQSTLSSQGSKYKMIEYLPLSNE